MQTLVFSVDLLSVSDSGIIIKPVQSLGEHKFKSIHPVFKIFELLLNFLTTVILFGSDNV